VFLNAKEEIVILTTLEELGNTQPQTPLETEQWKN
jgi:hypothetical protein